MVYEPREDSELLVEVVKKYTTGKVLDMGTGSGIQGVTALGCDGVSSVLAVDIDEESVVAAQKLGLDAVLSDRFSSVEGLFDTIICNAPYLPSEGEPDLALDGGPKGYEWTKNFLSEAMSFLSRDGQILLLVSTLTNQHVIEETMRELCFSFSVVARKKLFFEELIVYRITWALPGVPGVEYLAKGKRGVVYRKGDVVYKVADKRRLVQESLMLRKVNEVGIGPRFVEVTDDYLCMEYVPGVRIDSFVRSEPPQKVLSVLAAVEEQLVVLDELGIRKAELKNPYKHIIVGSNGPVLIDWERARFSPRPQNVAQFAEYKKRVSLILTKIK